MRKIGLFLILLGVGSLTFGQQAGNTQNRADQALRGSGRVNPSTLGMEIDIPLGSYPGRGINVPISLSYSSKLWGMKSLGLIDGGIITGGCRSFSEAQYATNSASGWTTSLAVPYIEYVGKDNLFNTDGFPLTDGLCINELPNQDNSASWIRRLLIHLPSGETHELRADDTPVTYSRSSSCPPANGYSCDPNSPWLQDNWNRTFYAFDGSNIKYVEDSTTTPATYRLLMPDGSRYDFSGSISSAYDATVRKAITFTDRNGNYIGFNDTTGSWTDTLGRTLTAPIGPSAPTQPTTAGNPIVYTMPGMTGSYKFHWKRLKGDTAAESGLTDFNQNLKYPGDKIAMGNNGNWSSRAAGTYLFGSTFNSYVRSGNDLFNPVVLTEIELPTGQKYKFSYDIYGLIERITYPTGSEEKFVHNMVSPLTQAGPDNVSDQTNRGVTNRKLYKSAGQGTPYEWNYSATHVAPAGYKISVISPDQMLSERFLYQGNGSGENGTYGFDNILAGMPYQELSFDSSNPRVLLSQKLTSWTKKTFSTYPVEMADWHPRVTHEELITYDSSGNQVSATVKYEYEGDLSLRESPVLVNKTTEYEYVATPAAQSRPDPNEDPEPNPTPIPTPIPPSLTPVKIVETKYLISDPAYAGVKSYYTSKNILGLPTYTIVKDGAGIVVAQMQMKYDENGYSPNVGRGNVTTTLTWDSTKGVVTNAGAYISARAKFDNYGNQIESIDARGNVGQVQFTDNFSDGINRNTNAFPTKTISTIPGGNGSTNALETAVTYDFVTGLPVSKIDVNGQTTSLSYNDPMTGVLDPFMRLRKVTAANGQQTTTDYDDQQSRWVKTRTQIDNVKWSEVTAYTDGLGRTIKTEKVDSGGNVLTETEYDSLGRVSRVTNPYRSGEPKLWSKTDYDEAGRIKENFAPAPDGQTGNSLGTTHYSISLVAGSIGTVVTQIDAAGKKKRFIKNAMGHLIRVDEPTGTNELGDISSPNQPTYYSYNTLGSMVKVQQGSQYRFFLHDSMGRVLRVRQPEQEVNSALNTTGNPDNNSWTGGFTYDNNGNALTATDARNLTVTNTFDGLNRINSSSYSDATPQVSYFYDDPNVPFSKGKLTKVANAISTTRTTEFDNVGRVISSQQITDGQVYTSQYQYNLSGGLLQETYPSGRTVTYESNVEGNLSRVSGRADPASQTKTYANSFSYAASGEIVALKLGNGRWETAQSNNMQQITQLGLGYSATDSSQWKVNYEYGELNTDGLTVNGAKNNGNIVKQTISFAGLGHLLVQTYKFDAANRLTEARETKTSNGAQTWQQTFGYDRYGNRTNFNQITEQSQLAINNLTLPGVETESNRFSAGQGYVYDKNGNVTTDANGRTFVFDGNNKQTEVRDASNNVVGTYYYDGTGNRVKKVTNLETTIFVYSGGKVVAEYSTQLSATPRTSYLTSDILGSVRVITDQLGNIISRRDFMPFGEEVYAGVGGRDSATHKYSTNDGVRRHFTTYQRDGETGLDFAEARYYTSGHGRFTAVDPLLGSGKSDDPQTFNRYVYVMNNPLIATDPSGMLPVYWRRLKDGNIEFSDGKPREDGKGKWTLYEGGELIRTTITGDRIVINRNGIVNLGNAAELDRRARSVAGMAQRASEQFFGETPSMSAGSPDNTGPLWLLFEWITGTGPDSRQFGPESDITQSMRSSPGLDYHRQIFINSGGGSYDSEIYGNATGQYAPRFGHPSAADGPYTSGLNRSRQFVGSFNLRITELRDANGGLTGDALFEMRNPTHFNSFLYGSVLEQAGINVPSWNRSHNSQTRGAGNIMGRTDQTFWWIERGVIKR